MTEKNTNSKSGCVAMGKEWLLHEAVLSNEAAVVRQILSDPDVLNIDCRNNYGRAPVHLAASRGNSEILKLLINAKCDIEAKDKFEMRPLHMAALHGQRAALELLLEAGAQATALDKNQRSLLMLAAQSSCHSSSSSSENQRQIKGEGNEDEEEIVLHLLNRLGSQAEMLEALCVQDVEGATAGHHAARHGRSGPIRSIGRKLGVEGLRRVLEVRDLQGRTALHEACQQGQRSAAAQLLELGADPLVQDSQGRSVLQLAAERRDSQLCCWMLSGDGLGPVRARALLELSDSRGYRLLHVAASLGCCVILQCLLGGELWTGPELAEQLRTGCLEAANSALHLAAASGQLQAVELLVQHGAELKLRNQLGQTPLELAEERGHGQVCRSLLRAEQQQEQSSSRARMLAITGRGLTNMASIVARTAHILYSLDYTTPKND
ncbi:serine/threonine-protein phosphatase 6 regulatory ankyrin repeat subunit C-like [Trichogramma pretiosum]|uniref:serine/threonine-protein phosphatase 6 regulatory ankyrin repeat subunit C-like n=1 Tax=Trichogramma pretiosum TaxID=7493 RepID=UPI0006C97011|nr:serine/threonine-protein phosphatase 6 regulatory ankyrin repeat subunit C-like [Trichogramma pretiosum]